jgi:hypothetical protein
MKGPPGFASAAASSWRKRVAVSVCEEKSCRMWKKREEVSQTSTPWQQPSLLVRMHVSFSYQGLALVPSRVVAMPFFALRNVNENVSFSCCLGAATNTPDE